MRRMQTGQVESRQKIAVFRMSGRRRSAVESAQTSIHDRWQRAAKESALDLIRHRVIIETQAEHLFACLKAGTVSTNVHLRKLHNFCLSMNWLPWPLIPKRL